MGYPENLMRFPEAIPDEDYIIATYYLETPLGLDETAVALAAEQSSGTWQRVELETDELRARHGAKVIGVYPVPVEITRPNLPTATLMEEFTGQGQRYQAGVLRIAFPHISFGPKLPNLLSAVAGNLFEMGAFTAIKLLALEFPPPIFGSSRGPGSGSRGPGRSWGYMVGPWWGPSSSPVWG